MKPWIVFSLQALLLFLLFSIPAFLQLEIHPKQQRVSFPQAKASRQLASETVKDCKSKQGVQHRCESPADCTPMGTFQYLDCRKSR